ncbi:hypothetical protein DFH08DRAFT_970209 [Mycena albidolilacea]|uniref:Uncharacterized protein n=1 Tax=Mycena albidolilacea TaxID=1033008 RepID=A0AAD6ZFV1_9AGAR|nr:hypothetical protein DFH08DRAFT_970209 [Mycena albidolilacea]
MATQGPMSPYCVQEYPITTWAVLRRPCLRTAVLAMAVAIYGTVASPIWHGAKYINHSVTPPLFLPSHHPPSSLRRAWQPVAALPYLEVTLQLGAVVHYMCIPYQLRRIHVLT